MSESSDHCHYVVPRKKRRCKMLIKPGNLYCGEHSHLFGKKNTENNRISCPLDPNHSVTATKLDSHLLKCPSKPENLPDFIAKSVNIPKNIEETSGLKVSTATDEQLLKIISKIDAIYEAEIEEKIPLEVLKHPLIEEEIEKDHIGAAASKHLTQNSSLLGHLQSLGVFDKKEANFIEFGSGRGQMTFWIAKASSQELNQTFTLVDKASHRHKYDNKLKNEADFDVSRIRADIQDLVIEKLPRIQNSKGPLIGVSKHLCGAATDLALRCLQTFAKKNSDKIEAILIALCCHHRCDWNIYVGQKYLLEKGFTKDEFSLLCGLSSWATCGTGKPREKKNEEKKDGIHHLDRYEKLNLPRETREKIGQKVKRILDMGRCQFVKESIKMKTVKLAFYADLTKTLENVVLIAQ